MGLPPEGSLKELQITYDYVLDLHHHIGIVDEERDGMRGMMLQGIFSIGSRRNMMGL